MADSTLKPHPPAYGVPQKLSAYAKRFSLPLRSVERWAASGKIPGQFQRGKRWFIRRTKASDNFGSASRKRREEWCQDNLTEWEKKVALGGMEMLPRPQSTPQPSFLDSPELLAAAVDLAVDKSLRAKYSIGKLIEEARYHKEFVPLLRTIFPRKKNHDIASALMAATFRLSPDDTPLTDVKLTDVKATRRPFCVKAFSKSLGISRAAFYKAWNKRAKYSLNKALARVTACERPKKDDDELQEMHALSRSIEPPEGGDEGEGGNE